MGGGATDHHLEDHHYPVQLYCTRYRIFINCMELEPKILR